MCIAINNRNLKKSNKNKILSSLLILPLNYKPGYKDILCGRGNVFSNHTGNGYFGRIVRGNLRKYRDASSRPEKIRVVDDIHHEIRASGAQFVKQDSEKRWYQLNDVQAHQKIGHAIRDTNRMLRGKKKTKPTTNKSEIKKRRRRSSVLQLILNHVRPSSETQQKIIVDDTLRISIDAAKFINDVRVDSEHMQPQPQQAAQHIDIGSGNSYTQYNQERTTTTTSSFLLKDEYPEESFDFSARSFFEDCNNVWPSRITSQ